MKKTLVVLAVILCATVAQAIDLTVMVGDEFVFSDVSLARMGPFKAFQVGIAGAINYTTESSSTFDDLDVDFGDSMTGLIVRAHALPEDSDITLCAFYAPMYANADISKDAYEILGATVAYKGFGLSYQRYLDEQKLSADPNNDRLLLSWTGTF